MMASSPSIGGSKSVAFAAFLVAATLVLSVFPTNAGAVTAEAGIDGNGSDVANCGDDNNESCGEILMLEDFAGPVHNWVEMNDPVMGGKSTGTFSVDDTEHVGVFHGSVEIVSFLNAPGFIKAETTKGESWPDASSCEGLRFVLRSSTPSYQGFRVSFGNKRPPDAFPYSYGFKTDLKLSDESSTDFQTVKLPFDNFTDKWDAGTGDAVVTCAENKEYCPEEADKKDLFSIAVWGEGVEGEVDLEIQSVAAYGCVAESSDSIDVSTSDTITIEDFESPVHEWRTMNDPVMGGRSKSSVLVDDGMARFEGTCAIVPFLHAPGFITMTTGVHRAPGYHLFGGNGGDSSAASLFPDVSGCQGLAVALRTTVEYKGYYLSFGTDKAPGGHHAMGYKTHLDLTKTSDFGDLQVPFSDFSSKWDDASGKTTVTCQEDPRFCPSLDNLRDMKTISFWGEGVEGTVALDVKSIKAYGCASGDGAFVASSATVSLQGNTYDNNTSFSCPSMAVVVALCSSFFVSAVVVRRFRRNNHQRSLDYEEVDMADKSGLV